MSNYIQLFNKNLELLLVNIIDNFSETAENIKKNYSLPIEGDSYLQRFIKVNKVRGTDIANKNEIIFSRGTIVLEHIELHYIWNHANMVQINKDIIWKYIQSLYLYSLEYTDNINFKQILRNYNETNIINNDTDRIVVNIFNNLSNKKVDNVALIETESSSDQSSFKMPDLSGFLGTNLMKFINNIIEKIELDTIELNNPLELVQLLLSGKFDLQNDTTGISLLVKNIIQNLKEELLSESLDKKGLFKDIENVLTLINTFTNNSYDFKHIIPDINDKDFNENFNRIINDIDFESIITTMVKKIEEIKENTNIDIGSLVETIMNDYTNDNFDISKLMGTLMKVVSGMQSKTATTNKSCDSCDSCDSCESNESGESNNLNEAFKQFNSLGLNNIISSVMGDLANNNTNDSQNNLDLNNLIQSITKNLPSELSNNIPKDLSNQLSNALGGDIGNNIGGGLDIDSMTNQLSNLLNGNNLEELKKMIPSSKNTRINTNKLNQLSRLEKRREILRKKLEERKQVLHLK